MYANLADDFVFFHPFAGPKRNPYAIKIEEDPVGEDTGDQWVTQMVLLCTILSSA